jgi:Ribosomal protein S11
MNKVYKRKLNKFDPSTIKEETTIYIHVQHNNIIITLTNPKGEVIGWLSSGSIGLRGFRKTSPLAAKLLSFNLFEKIKGFENKNFKLKIRGFNAIRKALLKYISLYNIKVIEMEDLTMIPFNGCRPQKRRKL